VHVGVGVLDPARLVVEVEMRKIALRRGLRIAIWLVRSRTTSSAVSVVSPRVSVTPPRAVSVLLAWS